MSHFSVLVVTPDNSQAALTKALQPFHEFECTGTNDEFVVDVDVTEEARTSYAAQTTTVLQDAAGTVHQRFDEEGNWKPEFSRPDGFGRRTGFVPEGFTEIEVPTSTVESFAKFAEGWYGLVTASPSDRIDLADAHKGGRIVLDDAGEVTQIIKRTNPNKKWDWWQVGGRFSGILRAASGASAFKGKPGLMGSQYDEAGVDSVKRAELDTETMRSIAVSNRRRAVRQAYDAVFAKSGLADAEITAKWVRFTQLRAELWAAWEADKEDKSRPWDWMRSSNPEFAALYEMGIVEIGPWGFDGAYVPPEEVDPVAWAEKAPPLSTFAFLDADGVWHQRGQMGWWACVSDEKDAQTWEDAFGKALDALDADHWVTVVDCHI